MLCVFRKLSLVNMVVGRSDILLPNSDIRSSDFFLPNSASVLLQYSSILQFQGNPDWSKSIYLYFSGIQEWTLPKMAQLIWKKRHLHAGRQVCLFISLSLSPTDHKSKCAALSFCFLQPFCDHQENQHEDKDTGVTDKT